MSIRKVAIYDKLHKLAFFTIIGFSFVTAGLFGYNCFLFKKGNICLYFKIIEKFNILMIWYCLFSLSEGVPMLLNKYRNKVEELTELKQKEAEYFEKVKRGEYKNESETK